MPVSVFDIFTIGIGPSSSHTVGPMRAAKAFAENLPSAPGKIARLGVEFFGSLGLAGRGHGTDRAVILGLAGETPEGVDPDTVAPRIAAVRAAGRLKLYGGYDLVFDERRDLVFHRNDTLPEHSNGMVFTANAEDGTAILTRTYYSVGGGFVVEKDPARPWAGDTRAEPPYPYDSAERLLTWAREKGKRLFDIVFENERTWRSEEAIHAGLTMIWQAMQDCVSRGCRAEGTLPGGLKLKRRAPALYRRLQHHIERSLADPLAAMDWVNVYALAVNEENAAGSRVVTAPTNGAAGIIPAVLHYVERFTPYGDEAGVMKFLLTAGGIGILYKRNASISGAEVGCQGEVGVACSMAAAGLAAVSGGTDAQIENAAEIGMEHNLGLTCDPVGSLVQIPCIERNAMGAVKAINAARIAIVGDGTHKVSLDKVIKTMLDTGRDMQTKYKETSQGGLAANVVEC